MRAGAALVAAGAIAEGITNLHRIYHIERGYENLENKLNNININTKKKKTIFYNFILIKERKLWFEEFTREQAE